MRLILKRYAALSIRVVLASLVGRSGLEVSQIVIDSFPDRWLGRKSSLFRLQLLHLLIDRAHVLLVFQVVSNFHKRKFPHYDNLLEQEFYYVRF